ncbi:MAG: protein kinase [Saprospiraceae bacterium]|nr:protein kinase [Pyrinomonadaceae bacterium]
MPATIELLQEGRYRINQESANDGNSTVYDAYDTVRDTNVVVKEIPVRLNKVTTVSQQELMKLAFASQAKILTEIHHDSLLHVQDFFSEIGRQYLVMESVDGDDLGVLLERNNSSFPLPDVLSWADQMLDALTYLHNFKPPIIHRNIRPEHIKLNSAGRIKLLAFGLAEGSNSQVNTALTDESPDAADISYSPLEQIWEGLDAASQKVITKSYDEKSERVLKQPADARSDIYALGATLYHLLTATKPVDALERSIDVMDGKPDPLRIPNKVNPMIPGEISDALMKAMAVKRENRFDSASIMRQVLRTALVRVKERETEEAMEQQEAAEDLKAAQIQTRHIPQAIEETLEPEVDPSDQQKLEMEAAQLSQTEIIKDQLRQAEEQRLLAEQRAAEAERRLREQQAAIAVHVTPVPAFANPDDDLLQILTPSFPAPSETSGAMEAHSLSEDREEVIEVPEENAVHESIEPFEETPYFMAEPAETVDEGAETVSVESAPPVLFVETVVEPAEVVAYSSIVYEDPTAIQEDNDVEPKEGRSLGMPVIALGVVAVLIIVVAAWMLMPNSSGVAESPIPAQSSVPSEPASEVQSVMPTDSAPVNAQTTYTAPVASEPSSSQPVSDASITPDVSGQKVKKPAPTPKPAVKATPSPKKAVTVEDLINDN